MNTVVEGSVEKLQVEQILGNKAQQAYDQFIKDFCEQKRIALFNSFSNLPLSDTENLMEVKRMLYAVDTLETDILSVIDTGRMASISLDDIQKDDEEEVKH